MNTRTLTIPSTLTRAGELIFSKKDEGDEGEMQMSISSDTPYLRFDWVTGEDYWEVLSHDSADIEQDRLKAGLPHLFNHDRNQLLGRATSYSNSGQKITVSGLIPSSSDFAKTKLADIRSGALPDTSVGYRIMDDGECIGAKDGIPIYKFKWAPHEFSSVTIPADITVGAGRTMQERTELRERALAEGKEFQKIVVKNVDDKKQPDSKAIKSMDPIPEINPPVVDVVKEREDGIKQYKDRCKKIRDFAAQTTSQPEWHGKLLPIVEKHCEGDANFEKFHEEALFAHPGSHRIDTPQEGSKIGMSRKDRGIFSVRKAIFEVAMQHRGQGKGLTGLEKEACETSIAKYGGGQDSREFHGLCIPDDVLHGRFEEDQDLDSTALRNLAWEVGSLRQQFRNLTVSSFAGGGALVATDLLAGSFIDILRNAVLIGQGPLGITELGGLMGNISIPKQTGTVTVYWLPEGGAITESDQSFAQLLMEPHRMGCDTAFTKQLLAQSSIGIEAFVRSDTALALAVEEDRVTLLGAGIGGEPLGIFNTTGVLSVTFGGNATFAKVVEMEYDLENANVRTGQMAIITSPISKRYMKTTVQIAASTFPIYVWMSAAGEYPTINGVKPGVVNDYPAYATKNVTTNVVCQGVFQNVFKGRWAGFDVVVDPYSGKKSELIEITTNQWLDIGLRYPQSFCVSTDAPTAPS